MEIWCPKCNGVGYLKGNRTTVPYLCSRCDSVGTVTVEPCCICGRASTTYYADREDCPSCGSVLCEIQMQAAMDHHGDCGNR